MTQRLAFLHAITPLHAGTGQGVGSIDLPIARERATKLPFVPGSTIKGCLRDAMRATLRAEELKVVFGPEKGEDASEHAGALRVSDARLLLFPVRSLGATFVWATSPFLLRRLLRDAEAVGCENLPSIPPLQEGQCVVSTQDPLIKIGSSTRLVLEELDFAVQSGDAATKWSGWISSRLYPAAEQGWPDEMAKRFAIIDDKCFVHLAEFATQLDAHIAIDRQSGTVEAGALWYQESLPAETVLISVLAADPPKKAAAIADAAAVMAKVAPTRGVQFGGKASTGHGVARFVPTS